MKRTRFFLLITGLLLVHCAQAQSETEIDRLKQRLRYSQPDSNRVRLLLKIADLYHNNRSLAFLTRYNEAMAFSESALTLSRSLGFRPLLGECLLAHSRVLTSPRKDSTTTKARELLTEALRLYKADSDLLHWADAKLLFANTYSYRDSTQLSYLREALAVYRKLNDRARISKTLDEYAQVSEFTGKFQEALNLQFERLAIQKSMPLPKIDVTLRQIGGLYKSMGDLPKALDYAYQGFRAAQNTNDSNGVALGYQSIGYIYSALGNHQAALDHYRAALKIRQSLQDPEDIVQVWLHNCSALRKLGRYQEALQETKAALKLASTKALHFKNNTMLSLTKCLIALRNYDQAESYLLLLLPEYPENTGGKADVYQGLGDVYVGKNQWKKAGFYYKRAFATSEKITNVIQLRREILGKLYRIDSTQGHFQSALYYHLRYTTLNNLLLNEAKNQQIALLQVRFDTEKKEQDIKLLQQDQASARTRLNATIGGAVLLLLLLGLTYNRYRLKQRSNQQLEAKQVLIDQKNQALQQVVGEKDDLLEEKEQLLEEREWMLKEIHHRVKNNLQVISSMLHSQVEFLHDPTALATIRESQNRVQVMALIHQKLYQTDNLARIGMRDYIHQIVDYLIESFDRKPVVSSSCEIADVDFDVSLATPIGLIINEAVTNSLKYAFPKTRKGTVFVALVALDNQTYRLTLSDDGIGLPADFDLECSNTLGLTMIRGLSRQIEGALSINQFNGVEINLLLTLPPNRYQQAG
jgi:two-component sensor histidine kinase